MSITNAERKYINLAREVLSDVISIGAQIAAGTSTCDIEIQLVPDIQQAIKIRLELPIDDDAAREAIRKEIRNYYSNRV